MSNWKTIALLSASVAAVSACSHSSENMSVANREHREIKVKEQEHYLELNDVSSGYLAAQDKERVMQFIAAFEADGYGPIVLTAPEGSRQAEHVVLSLRGMLSRTGIMPERIAAGKYVPSSQDGNSPIILAFKSYEAHVPGCSTVNEHDWSDLHSNASLGSFGCAVNENIAAMIANPGDLLGEREIGPGDSSRQLTVYEKYRLGESTASSQEADGSSIAE